ncbi:hypothetical protein LINPERHAP1_LOCUS12275 [Linum perenne]
MLNTTRREANALPTNLGSMLVFVLGIVDHRALVLWDFVLPTHNNDGK